MTRLALVALFIASCASRNAPAPEPERTPVVHPADTVDPSPAVAGARMTDGFPAYPNARELDSGHVNGGPGGLHITWWTTATTDQPAAVVAHYQRLGVVAVPRDPGWHFSDGDARLSVVPSAALATFTGPGKNVPPAATEPTVLVFSRAARPAP